MTARCGLCRGHGDVESANGYDVVCWQCDGTGDQPPAACPACQGTGGRQQPDGAIEECPRGCSTEDVAA